MPRSMTVVVCLLVALSASPAASRAQSAQAPGLTETYVAGLAQRIAQAGNASPLDGEIDLFPIVGGSLVQLLQAYEDHRTDEQVGATSGASGTTTLVSKGAVPEIFAFAMENGAIARTQSGTTLTFRGNVAGIFDAIASKGFAQTLIRGSDPSHDLLKRLSFSASFDASRGADAAAGVVFRGDQQQLSQWSSRLQLINRRDPMRQEYLADWLSLTTGSQIPLTNAAAALDQALHSDPAFNAWMAETKMAVTAPARSGDTTAIVAALNAQLARFPLSELGESTRLALDDYSRAAEVFVRNRKEVLDAIARNPQVAFEFTNDRPINAPKTTNLRLVGALGGSLDVIGNGSITLFEQIPPGATRRVRDVQFSAQIDMRFGSIDTTGPFVVSFAGKYLHQFENSYDDIGLVVPGTIGTTAVGQVKLTIPIKGTGVRLPLSLTFANRTELIKEKEVRGNVGITYDLDMLFAKFKP